MGDKPDNSSTLAQNPANVSELGRGDSFGDSIRLAVAVVAIGVIVVPLTLGFIGIELSCSNRMLLIGPYCIAGLVVGYYFSSQISLAVQTKISPSTSMQINALGSVAVAILAGWLGYTLFPSKTCDTPRSVVRIMELPLFAEDASADPIFTKHWEESRQRTMDYEFEIHSDSKSAESYNPRIKISKSPHPQFYCVLHVMIDPHGSINKNESIERIDDGPEPIYKIFYNPNVESTISTSRQVGDNENCFVSEELPLRGKTIYSVKLTAIGAQLVGDDDIKAAAIK